MAGYSEPAPSFGGVRDNINVLEGDRLEEGGDAALEERALQAGHIASCSPAEQLLVNKLVTALHSDDEAAFLRVYTEASGHMDRVRLEELKDIVFADTYKSMAGEPHDALVSLFRAAQGANSAGGDEKGAAKCMDKDFIDEVENADAAAAGAAGATGATGATGAAVEAASAAPHLRTSSLWFQQGVSAAAESRDRNSQVVGFLNADGIIGPNGRALRVAGTKERGVGAGNGNSKSPGASADPTLSVVFLRQGHDDDAETNARMILRIDGARSVGASVVVVGGGTGANSGTKTTPSSPNADLTESQFCAVVARYNVAPWTTKAGYDEALAAINVAAENSKLVFNDDDDERLDGEDKDEDEDLGGGGEGVVMI